ncbi:MULTISPECIES: hypothetical protein [Salipiger]|uniref:hypothetical protein n=1 Tax=Salipiger TaxID=263377 RepID=UPI0035194F9B
MTTDFLALARDRRIEALTARSLLLCSRHRRPSPRVCARWLRRLVFRGTARALIAPRSPVLSLALSGASGRVMFGRRFG